MTEQEWLTCTDPNVMLGFLYGKASDRKLRLFAVSCCHRIWSYLSKDDRKAVQAAEKYADGLLSAEDLERMHLRAGRSSDQWWRTWYRGDKYSALGTHAVFCATARADNMAEQTANDAASLLQMRDIEACAFDLDWHVMGAGEAGLRLMVRRKAYGNTAKERERRQERFAMQAGEDAWCSERQVQANLLRCVIANPFRPVPVVFPSWLAWNDGCVAWMAQLIYDERRFDELPILADALEEAGCDNADILNHCRQPGEHVRGCWVVDLLLNKS